MTTDKELAIFCHNIRVLRKNHGLSRTTMARRIHVSLKTLDSLESGVFPNRIGIGILANAEQAFGISVPEQLSVLLPEK